MPREGTLVHNPYQRLNSEQVTRIHQASMQLLNDPGLISFNRTATELLQSNGAKVDTISTGDSPSWHVSIPEQLVLRALESAPKTVTLGARNKDNALVMHGEEPRVYLVSGSETNIWLDVDFPDYVKKSDPSIEVKIPEFKQRRGIRPVNIQDKDITEDNKDVNKYFASLNNTTKHVMAGLTTLSQLDNLVNMARLIAGGEAQLKENPIISFITCLVKSPLQFVEDTTDTTIELCKRGLPVVISSSPQAGTSAPPSEAGIIAQINAEVLAGITLSQMVNKGTPVIYGSVPVRARLDTLSDSYGAPETSQYNVDCVQMARFYKLPCYSTSGVSDTKTPGLQTSTERLFSDIMVMLSGPQYLHCAYGLMEGNSIFSLLQAVLDDAHFQMIKFFLRPPRANQTEIDEALKQIKEVVATPQKMYIRHIRPLMRSKQLSMPYPFEGDGEKDNVMALAYDRMNELLAKPVEHIDQATTTRIFQEIPGILPRLNVYQ